MAAIERRRGDGDAVRQRSGGEREVRRSVTPVRGAGRQRGDGREDVGVATSPDEREVAHAVAARENVGVAKFRGVLDANAVAGHVGTAACCIDAAACSQGLYDAVAACATGCSVATLPSMRGCAAWDDKAVPVERFRDGVHPVPNIPCPPVTGAAPWPQRPAATPHGHEAPEGIARTVSRASSDPTSRASCLSGASSQSWPYVGGAAPA
jgi:hypothetical protein